MNRTTEHQGRNAMQWLRAAACVALIAIVAACGGGGGDSNSASTGGGSGSSGGSLPASPNMTPVAVGAANTTAISVGRGVSNVINIPTVSVTVCAPGSTTNCQTIDHIQLDTGSYGLRLVNTAVTPSLLAAMPVTPAPNAPTAQLAECAIFADGYTWGTVRTANVQMGGELASNIPINIIGDLASTSVPRGCVSGSAENTVNDLGANGILGVGVAPFDCGATCVSASTAATYSNYYACPNGANCARTAVPLAQQVANPVAFFPVDNNGVIVQMASVPNGGTASSTGTLVFGIGTQTNNAMSAATTLQTNGFGNMPTSVFNGSTVTAFLDSGSNATFFNDTSLAQCTGSFAGFYCPTSAVTRSVTLNGLNGVSTTANIGVMNASTLFGNGSNYAFNDLAGSIGLVATFDIGLPFFFGRYVYYGIDQSSIATITNPKKPFVAF